MRKIFPIFLVFTMVLLPFSNPTTVSAAVSHTWTEQDVGLRYWTSVALTPDGQKMVATAQNTKVYISNDGGLIWGSANDSPTLSGWNGITLSDNGSKIAASAQSDFIYISTNGGANWLESSGSGGGINTWSAIAGSTDGQYYVAAVQSPQAITISTDGGDNWVEVTSLDQKDWYSIDCSSDCSTIVAAGFDDYIYVSHDRGATWEEMTSIADRFWQTVSVSANGQKIIAMYNYEGPDFGGAYISNDGGDTWQEVTTLGDEYWRDSEMSDDGNHIIVAGDLGDVYISHNGGVSWTKQIGIPSGQKSAVDISNDGSVGLVADYEGYIHTGLLVLPAKSAIDNVLADPSETTSTITWITDIGADSQVEYGLTSTYTSSSTRSFSTTTSHSVLLTGLIAGTTYNYRVISRDEYGQISTSTNQTFTTNGSVVVSTPAPTQTAFFGSAPLSQAEIQRIFGPNPQTSTGTTSTSTVFTRNLQLNSRGEDVLKLQQLLRSLGYMKVKPNGNFGPATRAALIRYQQANKITPAVGFFGPVTRGVMGR
jgi:photosystem II stability/assembly factor-like uncharacterized protein